MPHASFSIFDEEDGEREHYCVGIVLDLDEVWPPPMKRPYDEQLYRDTNAKLADIPGTLQLLPPDQWKSHICTGEDGTLMIAIECYQASGDKDEPKRGRAVGFPFSAFSQCLTTAADLDNAVMDMAVQIASKESNPNNVGDE